MNAPCLLERTTDERPTSQRVVMAVADATGRDPLDLEPLYDVVDPDSLDEIFPPGSGRDTEVDRRVEFGLGGCLVVVHGDGRIEVVPSNETHHRGDQRRTTDRSAAEDAGTTAPRSGD